MLAKNVGAAMGTTNWQNRRARQDLFATYVMDRLGMFLMLVSRTQHSYLRARCQRRSECSQAAASDCAGGV